MPKFTTINPNLYTNTKSDIPDWLNDMNTDVSKKTAYDWGYTKTASWSADTQKIERTNNTYEQKEIQSNIKDAEFQAKIELAKFLGKKHYKVINASINNNVVNLNTQVDNLPGQFNFLFDINNGKLSYAKSFTYEEDFYPFNKAGLEECLNDIKNNKTKESKKVQTDKAQFITVEEIYRRYNGHIRQATDRINQLLKDGSIAGVTTNSFGTFYDVDYLFPQQDKEKLSSTAPTFEFVNNIEKKITSERKSAKQLTIDYASKYFESNFDDYKILTCNRVNDKLHVKATILKDNIKADKVFTFNIQNEKLNKVPNKIANIQKNTVNNLFNKQNKIYNNNIIKKQHIASLLKDNGYFTNENNVVKQLLDKGLMTRISNDTFVSEYSLNQLLSNISMPKQNKKKLNRITQKLVKTSREKQADTGTREANKNVNNHTRKLAIHKFISQYFDDYEITSFEEDNNIVYTSLYLFDNKCGIEIEAECDFTFDDNNIIDYYLEYNGERHTFEDISAHIKVTDTLANYNKLNNSKKIKSNTIFTKQQFKDITNKISKNNNIDNTLNLLLKQDKVQRISNDKYTSKFTLEQLINMSNLQALNKNELHSNIIKSQHNKEHRLQADYILDNDNREIVDIWSNSEILIYFKNLISKLYKSFEIYNTYIEDNQYYVDINAIDTDGINKEITVVFDRVNNHPNDIIAIVSNHSSKALEEFNSEHYKPNLYTTEGILTQKQLENTLHEVVEDIPTFIEDLIKDGYIIVLSNNQYKLNHSIPEIVKYAEDKNKYSNKNKQIRLSATKPNDITDVKTTFDNDNREIVNIWSNSEILIYFKNLISKLYKSFEMHNAYMKDNQYYVNINAIDTDGINKEITVVFDRVNNHPNDIIAIVGNHSSKTLEEFNSEHYKPNLYTTEGILTQKQLENTLYEVVEDIPTFINDLIKDDYIIVLSNNQYKLNHSIPEIVKYAEDKNKYSNKNKQIRLSATKSNNITDVKTTFDNDDRQLNGNKGLTKAGEKAKYRLLAQTIDMYKNQKLTLRKCSELREKIQSSKSERELENCAKILNQYQ